MFPSVVWNKIFRSLDGETFLACRAVCVEFHFITSFIETTTNFWKVCCNEIPQKYFPDIVSVVDSHTRDLTYNFKKLYFTWLYLKKLSRVEESLRLELNVQKRIKNIQIHENNVICEVSNWGKQTILILKNFENLISYETVLETKMSCCYNFGGFNDSIVLPCGKCVILTKRVDFKKAHKDQQNFLCMLRKHYIKYVNELGPLQPLETKKKYLHFNLRGLTVNFGNLRLIGQNGFVTLWNDHCNIVLCRIGPIKTGECICEVALGVHKKNIIIAFSTVSSLHVIKIN